MKRPGNAAQLTLREKLGITLRPLFAEFEECPRIDEIIDHLERCSEFLDTFNTDVPAVAEGVRSGEHSLDNDICRYREKLMMGNLPGNPLRLMSSFEDFTMRILDRIATKFLRDESETHYKGLTDQFLSVPNRPLNASYVARKIAASGKHDIGVAIGPEGYVFTPIFTALGMEVLNIHIDEYCKTEDRPYTEIDDLTPIEGKHVLFIEDDVRSGKTLQKAYSGIVKYRPSSVSVFLGLEVGRQTLPSVPPQMANTYTVPGMLTDEQLMAETYEVLQRMGRIYSIFKEGHSLDKNIGSGRPDNE
ncbi:phosphoribosyltransferase [Candidatus Woesearchaeota archaeon]|nr:phosphoribosyltransferase [Candidatus Woesearchaeota archaeon]